MDKKIYRESFLVRRWRGGRREASSVKSGGAAPRCSASYGCGCMIVITASLPHVLAVQWSGGLDGESQAQRLQHGGQALNFRIPVF